MNKRNSIFYFTNIITPLALGTILYCIFRPDVFYIRKLTIVFPFLKVMTVSASDDIPLVYFIRYYLMDILWAYSFMMGLCLLSLLGIITSRLALTLAVTLSVFFEFTQLIYITHMTFDVLDIILQIVAILIAFFLSKLYNMVKV